MFLSSYLLLGVAPNKPSNATASEQNFYVPNTQSTYRKS